ncbi:MAG: ABC transporter ATP-binding protein [Chloroflexota bacterium]
MPPIISVENLVKRYSQLTAVGGVSFSVEQGEVFGILGPNGAGKTTTLECIEGLQAPTGGAITVLGMDVAADPRGVKGRIGVQLQASSYFDYLTLTEILELFGSFYPQRTQPMELLARMGLESKASARVNQLSGGQKQRFSVAATLVSDPEIVFLDEPTTGLDPQARRNLWEVVQGIHAEGRTVVLTTHYMDEAQLLCDRVAIMDQGKLIALDTPARLAETLPAPYTVRAATPTALDANALLGLEGVLDAEMSDGTLTLHSSDATRTVPALIALADGGLRELEVSLATLEDVFLAMTGHNLRD